MDASGRALPAASFKVRVGNIVCFLHCLTHRGAVSAVVDAAANREGVRTGISEPRSVKQRHVPVLRLAAQCCKVAACMLELHHMSLCCCMQYSPALRASAATGC